MSYLSRAESMVERGQTMRAFYVLVNGLRKNPHDEHALNLLVDLYIRDIDSPGVEHDLLVVLEVVPNGLDIYEMIHASLEQSGDERRLKSLVQTRERDGLLPDLQPPHVIVPARGQPEHYDAHQAAQAPSPASSALGRETRFQRAAAPYPIEQSPQRYDAHPHQSAHEPVRYGGTPRQDVPDAWPTSGAHQPAPQTEQQRIDETEDDLYESTRETATTGMFSSINAYLSDQQTLVSEELAQRSKMRMLWIGLVVLVITALLVALTSLGGPDSAAVEDGPVEIDPSKPIITEPIPSDG